MVVSRGTSGAVFKNFWHSTHCIIPGILLQGLGCYTSAALNTQPQTTTFVGDPHPVMTAGGYVLAIGPRPRLVMDYWTRSRAGSRSPYTPPEI
ncbi:hypothetical protein VTH06DRAFT_2611 [Thermothelomyces fergusii]